MRVLMIVANPNPESFTHAIAARARTVLERTGHSVVVHDLYAEGFSAAMSAAERAAYHSDEPVLDPIVAQHIDDLRAAEAILFVYPTWWSSLPAILKGWLERVMVPGVGFVFNRRHKVRPGITNIRHIIGISTYGSSRPYVKAINDNGRRTLLRALRLSTGVRTRSRWLALYGIDASTATQRAEFLDLCERKLATL
jgi:NAD(P)H dehydrogenase (quinone)